MRMCQRENGCAFPANKKKKIEQNSIIANPYTPLPTVPFKSKLTLDSRSLQESRIENQVENQDSILDCCVSILDSCETHQTGGAFVQFRVIRSLLSILDCCENLQGTTFVQVLSNLLTSLTSEKSLYSNSTQHLILARNS